MVSKNSLCTLCASAVNEIGYLTAEVRGARRRGSQDVILTKPSVPFAFSAVKFFSSFF
jgi:hypothetical protein